MTRLGVFNRGLARVPTVAALLGATVVRCWWSPRGTLDGTLGWGTRHHGRRARQVARTRQIPFLCLEDGFLRSFLPGPQQTPLSLVLDDTGIYYDSTRPSDIEFLLASDENLLVNDVSNQVLRARGRIAECGLSKYNHAPPLVQVQAALAWPLMRSTDTERVLVVDQTVGDMSIALGGASAQTFADMLAAALDNHPRATVYVKTHPETDSGRKGGHFVAPAYSNRLVVLRHAINPLSLIKQMDRVYVVTSTLGFEALLAGKPVTVFGMPWYAGWGVTDDRCTDSSAYARRKRKRSVDELFAAAYLHYARYLNPVTHQRGTIFDVIDWLVRQREMADRFLGPMRNQRMICVGFPRWKAMNLKPLLSLDPKQVVFTQDVQTVVQLEPKPGDFLVHWGCALPAALRDLAVPYWARTLCMEDGFIRSVGLGSDLIPPLSVVLDQRGIYFDPSCPSDLEHILATATFTAEEIVQSQKVRALIVEHGITKYNLEPRVVPDWASGGREVVLVPGQVEDDASIRLGCPGIKTNLALLAAARAAHPEAFIVYKPHPDVAARNRKGRLAISAARAYADHVETAVSIVSCIDACDVVHTLTSLSGFDALLRGKQVVVHGLPFYAGWGLTKDVLVDAPAFARRYRRLSLDELVAGALLRYPIYWDWQLKGYTTCEAVIYRIIETRHKLEQNGGLQKLRVGFLRRQWRKLGILVRAWVPGMTLLRRG